jgi:YVTN family beta-propeller protein
MKEVNMTLLSQSRGTYARAAALTLAISALLIQTACGTPAVPVTTAGSAGAADGATTVGSPAAAGASPTAKPTATTLPVVPGDTTAQPLTHIDIPPLKGKTVSIDILEIDQATHLLYVTDSTDVGIDIFDISTPPAKYQSTIALSSGSNGVSLAKNVNKLFVANDDSTVTVIDIDPVSLKANTVIAILDTGGAKRADEMDYDPQDKKLYVANNSDGFVTIIDATTNRIIKKIDQLGSGLEQPRYNPGDGMMYLTGSTGNVLYQFDPVKDQLVKKFDVGDPCNPHGLAINPGTNQALLGCGIKTQQHTVLWDLKAGKAIATFAQAGAADAAIYDAKADRFFLAAANFYRGAQLAIFSGSLPAQFLTNVPTASGCHTVAYDELNKVIYTPDQRPGMAGLISFPLP